MKKWKRVLAYLIAFMMALPTEFLGMGTVAYAAEQAQIATPSDVMWKTDATATATWSAVAEANYYDVKVLVYTPDETFIGETVTGTTETMLDVQQEINRIMGDSYKKVLVQFTVRGAVKGEGETAYGEWSANSALTEYSLESNVYQLGVPANVTLSSDLVASWDAAINMEKDPENIYILNVRVSDGSRTKESTIGSSKTSLDLYEKVMEIYTQNGFTSRNVNVSFQVKAYASRAFGDGYCVSGEYSAFTSEVAFSLDYVFQLGIPQNLTFDESYQASWSPAANMDKDQTCFYVIHMELSDGEKTVDDKAYPNRYLTYNIQKDINKLFNKHFQAGTTVSVRIQIMSYSSSLGGSGLCKSSEYSMWTDTVAFTGYGALPLDTPNNLTLSDDYVISWTAGEDFYQEKYNSFVINFELSDGKNTVTDNAYPSQTNPYNLFSAARVLYNRYFTGGTQVQLRARVKAAAYSGGSGDVKDSEYSEYSNAVTFVAEAPVKLGVPGNVSLSNDFVVTMEKPDYFDKDPASFLVIGIEMTDGETTKTKSEYPNRSLSYDISSGLLSLYNQYFSADEVQVRVRAVAMAAPAMSGNGSCVTGDYSEYTNPISYAATGIYQLGIPENIHLDENFVITWDDAHNIEKDRENQYQFTISVSDGMTTKTASKGKTSYMENSLDVTNTVRYLYNNTPSFIGKPVSVKVQGAAIPVSAGLGGLGNCIQSDMSEWSNEQIMIGDGPFYLGVPQNPVLDKNLMASWDESLYMDEDPENTYSLQIRISDGEKSATTSYSVYRNQADLTAKVRGLYNDNHMEGKKVMVSFCVRAYASSLFGNGTCVSSDYSEYSESVPFADHKLVETITLSPKAPILYLGNSLFLGKTIDPEDAYYTSIDWTSSNADSVSVSDMGEISGLQVGTATVTATIEDASDSVQVRVYDIASNITDEDTRKEVTDLAGDILDDLNNNDNPNLDNTDITEDTLPDVKEDIEQGMERGDEFATDATVEEKEGSKDLADVIEQEMEFVEVVGAYELAIEVYHRSKQGQVYHITTIGKTDKGIDYTVQIPKKQYDELSQKAGKYEFVYLDAGVLKKQVVTPDKDGNFQFTTNTSGEYVLVYEEEKQVLDVKLKGISANLESKVGLNFYLEIPEWIMKVDRAAVEYAVDGKAGGMSLQDLKPVPDQADTYIYTCYVPASCMTKDIQVSIQIPDNKGGYISSECFTANIKEYADVIIGNCETYGQKAVDLAKAMLNYGAYAQLYFNEKTDALANDGLFEHQKNPVSQNIKDISDKTVTGTMENELMHFYGASLLCKTDTYVKLYFEANPGMDITQASARYRISATRNGEATAVSQVMFEEDGYYVLYINSIAPAELDDIYQITLTDRKADKTSTINFEYSPMNYIAGAQKSTNKALIELTRAMYYYNRAAEAYYR